MTALVRYKADLHVHTCLSPCGDLDNSPRGVVEAALAAGLDVIAVCDHNSAENVAATQRAAKLASGRAGHGLTVLAGLEAASAEEVHLLTIFETAEAAVDLQELVYAHLPPGVNRPEYFGEQVVANEDDEVEFFNERRLIAATDLDLARLIRAVHERGGLALAAHVDREAYGLMRQLGFMPTGFEADGLEVSARCTPDELVRRYPELKHWPLVRGSDAHFPKDLGSAWTEFLLAAPTLSEIALALKSEGGRKVAGIR